jgi:hypothetical protein
VNEKKPVFNTLFLVWRGLVKRAGVCVGSSAFYSSGINRGEVQS